MKEIDVIAIDQQRLKAMRENGHDEFGNPLTPRVAEGWEPLRCCLRPADEHERIALICYSPWIEPSPWAEAGPVFVHFGQCDGYPNRAEYPPKLLRRNLFLNPFDANGARMYEHITTVADGEDNEAAVRELAHTPGVAFVHVRSADAGCFTFEVRAVRS